MNPTKFLKLSIIFLASATVSWADVVPKGKGRVDLNSGEIILEGILTPKKNLNEPTLGEVRVLEYSRSNSVGLGWGQMGGAYLGSTSSRRRQEVVMKDSYIYFDGNPDNFWYTMIHLHCSDQNYLMSTGAYSEMYALTGTNSGLVDSRIVRIDSEAPGYSFGAHLATGMRVNMFLIYHQFPWLYDALELVSPQAQRVHEKLKSCMQQTEIKMDDLLAGFHGERPVDGCGVTSDEQDILARGFCSDEFRNIFSQLKSQKIFNMAQPPTTIQIQPEKVDLFHVKTEKFDGVDSIAIRWDPSLWGQIVHDRIVHPPFLTKLYETIDRVTKLIEEMKLEQEKYRELYRPE